MSRKKQTTQPESIPSGERLIIRLSFLVAFAISLFLAWTAIKSGAVPGCGPDSGCDKVLSSQWSRVFGLPVSIPALLVYAVLLLELFRKTPRWHVTFPLAALVIAAAFWFTAVQAVLLKSFCPYCMAAHLAGFVGATLLIRRGRPSLKSRRLSVGFAALSILFMATLQAISPAPAPAQVKIETPVKPIASAPEIKPPPPNPIFPIFNGGFQLDLNHLPISGPVTGTNRVVKLFDYTCHHCRDLHHLLHSYASSNELTIVSLPVPLESTCNPFFKQTSPAHFDACEYARIGLAVFYAQPNQFAAFSDWIYAPERPPTIVQTRAHAETLVGKEAFASALQNPAIQEQIKTNIAIYQTSSRLARKGSMPQLIFASSVSVGAVKDMAQLERIMNGNLKPAHETPVR